MFTDALEIKLQLKTGGKKFDIPGGNVKKLAIDLHQYGFQCELTFRVSAEEQPDKMFPLFTKQGLIDVTLQLSPHFKPEKEIDPLILSGLVTHKSILTERTIENVNLTGNPILYRHYRIVFADPAQVLWRQHLPCDLLTDKTIKDLIEAHKGQKVSLKYDWNILDTLFAVNTLPLGTEKNEAGFYDFVIWFIVSNDGVFSYDCQKGVYTISKNKNSDGRTLSLNKLDIEGLRIEFPETIRYNATVLNAYTENPERKTITQDESVAGVEQHSLGRFPISSDFEKVKSLTKQKLKTRGHEIRLNFRRFPLIAYHPGCFIKVEGGLWSDKIFPHGKVYRVRDISIEAQAVKGEITADHNMAYARYNIDMNAQLELKTESWVSLPSFKSPAFPIYVEGKIVSEQGKEDEETYQIYQHPQNLLDQYRVAIPLWDNQQIVVPYEPLFSPGHFYFPAYKGARVIVALDFHSGRIERFLDWRSGSRLPMDSEGNHLLLGKTAASNTSINHVYVDNKPVLNIERTSDADTELIKMEEGSLILQTKEKES